MKDDDLGSMQRAALKSDGAAAPLYWLAQRFDASAVLLDYAGKPEQAIPDSLSEVLRDVAEDINRLITRECSAVSVRGP